MSEQRGLPVLNGLRILDFTRVLAGPLATALLADLGAEVIKVEPPLGDDYRAIGPMQNGESALFNVNNRNKKSLVVDLKREGAREVLLDFADRVDVVIENFRPGVAERLGVGPRAFMSKNPKLVYVSVSGFGQTGPYADRPAYDVIVQAMSGIMEATGDPNGPPTLVGEAMSDVVAGLFASWGILAALHQAKDTGKGQHVDVAMFDATMSFLVTSVARFLFTGKPAFRVGNRHPLSAPFGLFRAQDGFFALAILNRKLFMGLADAIARPDLGADEGLASDEQRSAREPELRAAIEAWASKHTVEDVVTLLSAVGLPVAPVWNVGEALESEQALSRGLLQSVSHDRLPDLRLPVQPVRFGGSTSPAVTRAPSLGEHTGEILSRLLGYDASKIADLRHRGVVSGQ